MVKKAVKKPVKKKTEKKVVKKKVVKKPVKKKTVKRPLSKFGYTTWEKFLETLDDPKADHNQPVKLVLEEEKVYKWVSVVFHSEYMADKVKYANSLGGKPVPVEQYKNNQEMFDNLVFSSVREWAHIELEKDDNVCKLYKNTDGTINKMVLFEFPKSSLDARDKEHGDMIAALWESGYSPYDVDVSVVRIGDRIIPNPIPKSIEVIDEIIAATPKEALPELAKLINQENREEWRSKKAEYLASHIDNAEIDYLGEHTTFKAVANKYLDSKQKEIADITGMSRFRYLLYWVEDILEQVNSKGFYTRGRVQVEGYESFEG